MSLKEDNRTNLDKATAKTQESKVIVAKLCLILSSLSILVYLSFASFAPFKNDLFLALYPKTPSEASTLEQLPQVDLQISYKGTLTKKPVNIATKESSESSIDLIWTSSGNITSCTGRTWDQSTTSNLWSGAKDPKGGTFNMKIPTDSGAYVYTIDCSGPSGDANGDSVTINVGRQDRLNLPYLVDFQILNQDQNLDINNPSDIPIGQKINLNWSTLNTATPYSICVSSGSWPKKYLRQTNIRGTEEFTITERKVYKYTLYCSNERSFIQNTITINGT